MSVLHWGDPTPHSAPCMDHPCDECPTCQRGRCCRGDDPDYQLPEPGSWPDPIYGEIGSLREDGTRLECHICGGWYVALGVHAWQAHNVTGDEYRALFGLTRGHGLSGADLRRRQSAIAQAALQAGQLHIRPLTEEQRAKGQEGARRPRIEHQRQAKGAITAGRQRLIERMADPDYNQAVRRAKRVAAGGDPDATATCPICGKRYHPGKPSRLRSACSPSCSKRWVARRQVILPPDLYQALERLTGERPVEEMVIVVLRAWTSEPTGGAGEPEMPHS